ncbi:MAG: hypothetical protein F4213_06690 [Boseongicola sp. SB0677_bin_26]|nr:hypothetical protein [Boseongicola sp. SB0677_bin_26]
MIRITALAFMSAAVFLANFASVAQAQFYKGKQINVLVNYGAGGSTDVLARLVTKHLEKHIPGSPELIVSNMAGAGGIVATNHMGEVAKADGLTLAFFATPFMQQALGDPALTVDLSKFIWLGGFGQPTLCFIRNDAGTGLERVDDLPNIGEFKMGGYRPTSSTDIRMRLGLDLLGVEYRYVSGYRSSSKVLAAMLQDEVQYSCASVTPVRSSFGPNLVEPGLATLLWYYSLLDEDGNPIRDPRLEGIPTFVDVYESLKGEKPSGILFDSLTAINDLAVTMLRGVFLPEGTPEEAVEALGVAWQALAGDEEFIAEYQNLADEPPSFLNADEARARLDSLGSLDPEIIAFIGEYVQQE